jgi:hypothetical protein
MPREEIIEHFKKAEDLVDALGRRNKRWNGLSSSWVFRGHADASWDLLPSALRTPCPITHHPRRPKKPYEKTAQQVEQEVDAVWGFVKEADYYGLPIPGDASRVLHLMDKDRFEITENLHLLDQFPSEETIEAYALAQHHGVPTRLLDWSRNPLVAAYFSAEGAARALNEEDAKGKLGIWCFCWNAISTIDREKKEDIHLVSPPRAPNKNLLAQNGVFTVHVHPLNGADSPVIEPFDELVHRLCDSQKKRWLWGETGPIRLLTLPVSQSRHLLRTLAEEDVTAAKLFPGYDGIVRARNESLHLWQSWRSLPEER